MLYMTNFSSSLCSTERCTILGTKYSTVKSQFYFILNVKSHELEEKKVCQSKLDFCKVEYHVTEYFSYQLIFFKWFNRFNIIV